MEGCLFNMRQAVYLPLEAWRTRAYVMYTG